MKMKSILYLASVFFFFNLYSSEDPSSIEQSAYQSQNPYHLKAQMKQYRFSTVFEIDSEDSSRASISKSCFSIRINYDLYDEKGWRATGVRRMCSLGSWYNWGADIDIYNNEGELTGFIEGTVLTTAKAKFHFYDNRGNCKAVAYFDLDNRGVTICSPENENHILAKLTRKYELDIPDTWKAVVYEPREMDPIAIQIFLAFCLDSQDSFHEDK